MQKLPSPEDIVNTHVGYLTIQSIIKDCEIAKLKAEIEDFRKKLDDVDVYNDMSRGDERPSSI